MNMFRLLVDLGEELMVAEEGVFFLADFDGGTTVLGDQNLISWLHGDLNSLSISVQRSRSNSQHLGLVQVFDCALGQENATGCLSLGFYALNKHAVEEGRDGADGFEEGGHFDRDGFV